MTAQPEPTESHRLVPARGFEQLQLGERFPLPSRTVIDAHFSAFQALSGDNHPIHYDREYCRRHGHPDLLAHGLQVAATTAAGAGLFAHVVADCLIAFLEQTTRFLAPVYSGDTLSPLLEISLLERQRTTGVVHLAVTVTNQRGERVLEGEQKYLLRLHDAGSR